MIFQLAIDLHLKNKTVQAILDLDTGLVGFTEKLETTKEFSEGNEYKDYTFLEAPHEFKLALADQLVANSQRSFLNSKICRKSELAKLVYEYHRKEQKGKD